MNVLLKISLITLFIVNTIHAKALDPPQPTLQASTTSPPPPPTTTTSSQTTSADSASEIKADSSSENDSLTVTTAASIEMTNLPEVKKEASDEIIEKPKAENSKCSSGDQLTKMIMNIIEKKIPCHIKLPSSVKGEQIPLRMENGFVNIGNKNLSGQPSCSENVDGHWTYNFFVDLNDLNGAFEWQLFNLFNNNFSESVIITLSKLEAEFNFDEMNTTDGNKLKLKSVRLGPMETVRAKVNLPEKVVEVKVENRDIDYIKSRITMFVDTRAKEILDKELNHSFEEAIKDSLDGKLSAKTDNEQPITTTIDAMTTQSDMKTTVAPETTTATAVEGSTTAKSSELPAPVVGKENVPNPVVLLEVSPPPLPTPADVKPVQ